MRKIIKVKSGDRKATEIFDKIYKAEIFMTKFKKAIKSGRRNINKLRVELKKLTDQGYYPTKECRD